MQPVDDYLATELQANRVMQLPRALANTVHISRFGVIPKPKQPGRWRLILDLSSPEGHSINDGIDPDISSVSYASVDDAVTQILRLGRGTMMAKVDIEHAYRNVPVHPGDRHLLGMSWRGKVFVDTVLPFGLRSAPKIFSAMADALQWILVQGGVSICIHYLDDFLTMGPPNSNECLHNLELIIHLCK